jgi:phosphatidate cytidylyltransferase
VLRDRARSAAIFVPPLLVAIWLGDWWIVAVVAIGVAVAARETFRLLESAGHASFPALGTVLAIVIAIADQIAPAPGGSGLLLASVGVVLVGCAALTRLDPREGLVGFATTTFAALYVGMLGFVLRLGGVAPAIPDGAALHVLGTERGWILVLVLVVWSYDTGAYLVGRRFGRRRFMTHISPSKTVEGVAGGALTSLLVGALLVAALGQNAFAGALLGLLIAAAAQAGDLAESMLKRAAGAKDSGRLIPGHGGMLDRIDSFLFAAPAAVLYVVAIFR